MEDTVQKNSDGRQCLKSIADELRSIAYAFATTGNNKMFDKLDVLAENIEYGVELMDQAYSELLTATHKQAQESTGQLLMAVIGGINLAKQRTEEE